MVGPVSKLQSTVSAGIDRAVLRVMDWAWMTGGGGAQKTTPEPSLDVYLDQLGRDPAEVFPVPSVPAVEVVAAHRIAHGTVERYRWRSTYQTWDAGYQSAYDAYEANRFAHAECVWHDSPGRPTIICLHAWMTGGFRLQRRIFLRRYLFDLGFNVVLFMLPFHGDRTPAQAWFSGQLFPGRSVRRTNEGFGQTAWDVRALVGALAARRSGPIGVMGMSVGGYSAALLAAIEARLAFAVPIIPFVDMPELMWIHGRNKPERLRAETAGRSLEEMRALYALHCPLSYPARLPRERLMIIAGSGDRICTRAHVARLWEHWGRCDIHWWPGSHVAHFGRERSFAALGDFLKRRVA